MHYHYISTVMFNGCTLLIIIHELYVKFAHNFLFQNNEDARDRSDYQVAEKVAGCFRFVQKWFEKLPYQPGFLSFLWTRCFLRRIYGFVVYCVMWGNHTREEEENNRTCEWLWWSIEILPKYHVLISNLFNTANITPLVDGSGKRISLSYLTFELIQPNI